MSMFSMGSVGVEQEHYPEYIDQPPMHPVNIAAVLSQMGPITCEHIVDILMRDFPDAPEEDINYDSLEEMLRQGYYSHSEEDVHYNLSFCRVCPIMEDHDLTLYYLSAYSEQETVRFEMPDMRNHFVRPDILHGGIRVDNPFAFGGDHRMDAAAFEGIRVEPAVRAIQREEDDMIVQTIARGQRAIANGVDSVFDGHDWAPVEPVGDTVEIDMDEVMRRAREINEMDDYTETYMSGAVTEDMQHFVNQPMNEATFLEMRDTIHNTVHSVLDGTR